MKTLNSMTKSLMVLALAAATLSLTACPSNQTGNGQAQRGNVPNGVVNPVTGQVNNTWGAITNSSGIFTSYQLALITGGVTNIGTVSGNMNDPSGTGVVFEGAINQTGSGSMGSVVIAVWDSIAASGGAPLSWTLNVVQVAPYSGDSGANVVIESGSSQSAFEFSGNFNGGMWQGTFSYVDPSSSAQYAIGNFSIPVCSIFVCN